jgi:Methyltransferase domain
MQDSVRIAAAHKNTCYNFMGLFVNTSRRFKPCGRAGAGNADTTLTTAARMVATEGAAATLRFTNEWIGRQFRRSVVGLPSRQYWRKFHLIHELARIHRYRSLLEISTARTGYTYGLIDRSRFDVCRRLSYLTPKDWTDGAPVDYRSCDRDTSECLRQIRAQGLRFDIVFVDGCHEYENAHRDMQDALSLVNDKGIIVAHDCLPDSEAGCTPSRGDLKSNWYGVTYKAYLDVLIARNDLWCCTVDADIGCGMIRSNRKTRLYKRAIDGDEACLRAWRNVGDNCAAAYRIYDRNRNALMNVVTVNEFLTAEWLNRTSSLLAWRRMRKAKVVADI